MKRVIASGTLAMAFVSLLGLGLVSQVQAGECSNASTKGSYGFSCEGTIVGVGPLAVIGVYSADGNGTSSGTETVSLNGTIIPGLTFTGTYSVNANCTGSLMTTTPDGAVTHHDLVIDDNKKEIRILVTEPGRVIACIFRKQ